MKMLKKSVSVLLSLIMVWGVFSAAPFCVGAATVVTTWQQLVSAVSSGGSVILGADITSGPFDSFLHITGGKRVDVDLNGYALSRGESGSSETRTVFKIGSGATLRITDSGAGSTGKISGGSSEQGGAFFNEGTLLIEGGSICQNTSSVSGGAVYNKGTFTMSGGMLSGNISEDGGALFNAAGGTAVLSGTAILKDNECHTYGGGAVTNYGQLTVSDSAEISNNKAFMRGGGIWTGGSSTLNLYGGTITENSAGITGNGVYYRDGTLNMKGSPIIRCNDEDDLFLCEGKKINITGKLTRSSPDPVEYPNVAIVTSGADRIVTSGYSQYNPDASDPSFFFFSYDHHYFTLENGEVYSEAFKTSYVYRYWDEAAEKVRTGRGERSDAIDVATLQDNSSVSLRDNWYIVRGNVTIRHRLTIAGTANLILADGAVLTCKDGIRSERKLNSVLNIYPQSEGTGKLISKTGGQNWAAIGGNTAADAGAFNLHGGTIEASAPRSGIAGGTNPDGNGGAGGPVKIFAGTVNVTATDEAALGAAIGGGDSAPACWDTREGIAIYGGTVAVKSYFGSGIGNGSGEVTRSTGAISIYGGKIDARGDTGVGGGNSGKSSGLITINGGVVDATGSKYGAGIGGGNQHIGTVVINGGSVTAQGGYHAAGIGGGTQGLATVTVNGGVVNATGGDSGAGIGAGYNNAYLPNKALNVTINGGIITATGGSGASAIGCGDRTDYGSCSVSINGGQITANGGVSSKCTDSRQGSIILNWTDDSKASMSLTSDSYSGAVTLSKTFRDENGNIYGATDSADNSALAGKTLTPCEGIFAGYSLSLGGDIGVNFYLDLPDEALAQGVRIDFAWNGKTDSVTFDSNSTAETREGVAGLYKATCNVCAAEMNDAVTACVTVGESAGPVETVSRKVRDYADYILANKDGKYSDKLITLVKSMLNYGANAQTQFEHNTDALANAGVGYPLSSLNDNEINGIAGAVPEKDSMHALLADKGIAYHGYSLILNTKTTLRFYFKKDGADYTQLALLNSAGANVGTVQDQDTDDCYIEVGDISAFELGDCYELKFGDTTLGSFSALSYVKDVLQNNNGAQPITDTVTALYRYHEAAAAYFNHNA